MSRRLDIGFVLALAWLLIAAGITVLMGPDLGLRGWIWLGAHHVLCVTGCSHELWRARRRRTAALGDDRPGGNKLGDTVD